jgi:hypothetical protein
VSRGREEDCVGVGLSGVTVGWWRRWWFTRGEWGQFGLGCWFVRVRLCSDGGDSVHKWVVVAVSGLCFGWFVVLGERIVVDACLIG